jgi:hypothetical protein
MWAKELKELAKMDAIVNTLPKVFITGTLGVRAGARKHH